MRGSTRTDTTHKLQAMNKGFFAMGSFWSSGAPYKIKRTVSQCMVTNSGEAGLDAAVLDEAEVNRLEKRGWLP